LTISPMDRERQLYILVYRQRESTGFKVKGKLVPPLSQGSKKTNITRRQIIQNKVSQTQHYDTGGRWPFVEGLSCPAGCLIVSLILLDASNPPSPLHLRTIRNVSPVESH
jgi:hypothetical protein